jgi:hypothetical protein
MPVVAIPSIDGAGWVIDATPLTLDVGDRATIKVTAAGEADAIVRVVFTPAEPITGGETTSLTLEKHLAQIRKRFDWGEIEDAEYLRDKEATERELALLPGSDDRLLLFDRHREIAVSMAENLAKATPAQRREFVTPLVERVVIRDRTVAQIEWVPAARPFMAATGLVVLARPAGLEPTTFRSAT